jgi:anti-anti-sigma regulatory factor
MLADVSYTPTTRTTGVLSVRGTIGLWNARDICVVMLSLIDDDAMTRLSVDLSDAEFLSAAGALALLAARRYGGSSCSVELVNPSPSAYRFIDILAPDLLDAPPNVDLSQDTRTQRDRIEFDELVRALPRAASR